MSIEITVPEYSVFTQALQQQGVGLTPAEMHGLISGILCGGNQNDNWRTMIHDLTNEGEAFSQTLAQPLQATYQHTRDALEDDGFGFQLLLPDSDDVTVFDRADALSGWVNHFRKATQALISSSVPGMTTMPAPCWTATGSQPAKLGQGSAAISMPWLSVSLVSTWVGKKEALEEEPT